jgi:hypothetical protein
MAQTGIIQRRDTKTNLELLPPVEGELVFALDTGEHGWLDENGVLVWKKLNEEVEIPDIPEVEDFEFIFIPKVVAN